MSDNGLPVAGFKYKTVGKRGRWYTEEKMGFGTGQLEPHPWSEENEEDYRQT